MLPGKWIIKIIGWVLLFGYDLIFAQNPQINGIVAYASKDSLRVDFSIQGVWEEKLAKTLLAGVPLTIHLNFNLLNIEEQVIYQKSFKSELNYDVWEEKFTLQEMPIFPSIFYHLSELKTAFESVEHIGLVPLHLLHSEEMYRVGIDFIVLLPHKKQKQDLQRWMETTEQTEEEFASGERSTGFRLNINQLVQFFLSHDQKSEEFRVYGVSTPFTLSDVKMK